MLKLTLEELVAAAQKLPPSQQAVLVHRLQQTEQEQKKGFTREQAISELEALRAEGAFDQVESLFGKYAGSGVDVTAEELSATLHKDATEWENELDEFFNDKV
jgi:hypothetical protein